MMSASRPKADDALSHIAEARVTLTPSQRQSIKARTRRVHLLRLKLCAIDAIDKRDTDHPRHHWFLQVIRSKQYECVVYFRLSEG